MSKQELAGGKIAVRQILKIAADNVGKARKRLTGKGNSYTEFNETHLALGDLVLQGAALVELGLEPTKLFWRLEGLAAAAAELVGASENCLNGARNQKNGFVGDQTPSGVASAVARAVDLCAKANDA